MRVFFYFEIEFDTTNRSVRSFRTNDNYARPRYAPSSELTRMISPALMKRGTWTVRPVWVLIGFWTLPVVSPRIASGASTTFISTEAGRFTRTGRSSTKRIS